MISEKAEGPVASRTPGTATITSHKITEGPDSVDEALAEIRRWERAARLVADDPALSLKRKCFALLEMMARARRSDLAAFLETAVWRGLPSPVRGGRPRPGRHDRRDPPTPATGSRVLPDVSASATRPRRARPLASAHPRLQETRMSDVDDGEELAKEVLAEVEKILEGGGDDGHRAPDQEVGDPPAGGAGGRPTDPGTGGAGEGRRRGSRRRSRCRAARRRGQGVPGLLGSRRRSAFVRDGRRVDSRARTPPTAPSAGVPSTPKQSRRSGPPGSTRAASSSRSPSRTTRPTNRPTASSPR